MIQYATSQQQQIGNGRGDKSVHLHLFGSIAKLLFMGFFFHLSLLLNNVIRYYNVQIANNGNNGNYRWTMQNNTNCTIQQSTINIRTFISLFFIVIIVPILLLIVNNENNILEQYTILSTTLLKYGNNKTILFVILLLFKQY